MKIYKVEYDGLWMGGIAIVMARNENTAREEASAAPGTVKFDDVVVTEVADIGPQPKLLSEVLYNYNGDY